MGSAVPDFVIREQSLEAVEEKVKGVQAADGREPSDESEQQQSKSSCLLWLVIALMVLLSLVLLRTASGKTPSGARPTSQGESTQPGKCDERPMVHLIGA